MKNPNGYGSVVRLKGNRRNPFAVRKVRGWNEKGHPIYDVIGYFPSREAGMIALAQYNNEPWDVNLAKTTFAELFQFWLEKRGPKLGSANLQSLKSASRHCEGLAKMKYKLIKAYNMQECIDQCGLGYSTQSAIKNLFGHLDRFAFELEIINRCCSDLLTSESIPETSKIPFSTGEIDRLWEISAEESVDSILIFLYTGFRISELLDLRRTNIDLDGGTIKGGKKTKAGKDRVVPIHPRIAKFIEKRFSAGCDYLFSYGNNKKCTVGQYYTQWNAIMKRVGMSHTPHECRHTFRSRLDSAGANKRCIDLLMGHKSKDVGERVYTHKTIQELKAAIELLI